MTKPEKIDLIFLIDPGQVCPFHRVNFWVRCASGNVLLKSVSLILADKFPLDNFPPDKYPCGQIPGGDNFPPDKFPGRQASKKDKFQGDNFPPDKFQVRQLPPGQVPDQTYSTTLRPKGAQKPPN